MGHFTYGTDPVTIASTSNIVLERLRVQRGDVEQFRLHRVVNYTDTATGTTYTVPPDGNFETDLTSVPQLLTWLVPKSGTHLPAALVHDHLVDDNAVERHEADRIFRDAMGDLGVGFIRRWLMWTAVSLFTVAKRGSLIQKLLAFGSLALTIVLGGLATWSLFTDRTIVPWMGSRGVWSEIAFGLAGAVVVPIVLGALMWGPIRTAGVIAGLSVAVLLHVMVLMIIVYGMYLLIERLPRAVQSALAITATAVATAAFVYALLNT